MADSKKRKTAADKADEHLATIAREKTRSGDKLTQAESAALRRVERREEEEKRWEYYATIPQKHWVEMSGRQAKTLREQATLHGFPIGDKVIDLTAFVRRFHDFLSEKRFVLQRTDQQHNWKEELQKEQALIKKIERMREERKVVEVQQMRDMLTELASILKKAGELLHKSFGEEALEILNEAIDDFEGRINRFTVSLDE